MCQLFFQGPIQRIHPFAEQRERQSPHHRGAQHHKHMASFQGNQGEPDRQQVYRAHKQHAAADKQHHPVSVKGHAHPEQHDQAHQHRIQGGHGAQLFRGAGGQGGERLHPQHDAQRAGRGLADHGLQKLALYARPIGLQGQEKRGNADGNGGKQGELNGFKGIARPKDQADDGQQKGEQRLGQKQRGRAPDVVDHPPSLQHHMGHGGKVVVQQHQLGHLARRVAARGHGHRAVGLFERGHVVHPVSGHGHHMALVLERAHQPALLLGRYPAEYLVLGRGLPELFLGLQGAGVHAKLGVPEPGAPGHRGHGLGIVPGDHPEVHILLGEKPQGIGGLGPDLVGQGQQGQRLQALGQALFALKLLIALGQHQHPLALLRAFFHPAANGWIVRAQHKFPRAQHQTAQLFKARAAPLAGRGKGHHLKGRAALNGRKGRPERGKGERGYPPTVREICETVNLKSTSSVHSHLETLEKNGYIRRDPTKPRAIEICDDNFQMVRTEMVSLPVIGNVAAGQPILAEENVQDYFPVPADVVPKGESFILNVRGESMINAGIFNGDRVFVHVQNTANNGEIVVALIDDSATVKTFYKEKGHIRLQPENDTMDPIIVDNCQILGTVFGVFRFYR